MTPLEQARLLAVLRRARRGHWLAIHILLLLTLHRSPSEMAAFLLCARSTVYAVAQDWQKGRRWPEPASPSGPPCFTPSLRRSLLALLNKTPAAYGWCRTRWSCATLALQLQVQRGICLSAETVRRCLHALDWVWKRAKLAAKDSDPERAAKLARIRHISEHLGPREALLFADELDLHLLPKVGAQWMPRATQVEVMTPGPERTTASGRSLGPTHGAGALLPLVSQSDRVVSELVKCSGARLPGAALGPDLCGSG